MQQIGPQNYSELANDQLAHQQAYYVDEPTMHGEFEIEDLENIGFYFDENNQVYFWNNAHYSTTAVDGADLTLYLHEDGNLVCDNGSKNNFSFIVSSIESLADFLESVEYTQKLRFAKKS